MAVEIQDDEYKKLVKNANDNQAIMSIFRWFVLIALFIFVMAAYGCHALEMKKQIDRAHISVEVREIESAGLTTDEYLDWLAIKNGETK